MAAKPTPTKLPPKSSTYFIRTHRNDEARDCATPWRRARWSHTNRYLDLLRQQPRGPRSVLTSAPAALRGCSACGTCVRH
eukprot:287876-Prymnesium_polylepis.1